MKCSLILLVKTEWFWPITDFWSARASTVWVNDSNESAVGSNAVVPSRGDIPELKEEDIHNNGLWICLSVRPHEMTSAAAAIGPMDMIFGMGMYIDDRIPIFGKPGSWVKG